MNRPLVASFLFLVPLGLLSAQDNAKTSPAFTEVVGKHFSHWDKDKNGELSLDEINRAVVNPEVKGSEAAAIVALRRAAKSKTYTLPKLTPHEVQSIAALKPLPADKPNLNSMYDSANAKISKINRELFPKGKPDLSALNQGKLGDCFCLAPLGAICHRNPDDVTRMITKTIDGTFDVKLGKETINIPAPTDAELALSASTDNDGIWVNVYEKAVGEMRIRALPEKERPVSGLDLLTKGGSAGTMLATATGHPIERFTLVIFKNDKTPSEEREARLKELREHLVKAFAEKRLVTTGTNSTIKPKTPNINTGHAYAIIGFDAKSDKIRIWNPHGQNFTPKGAAGLEHGYLTVDGQFEMPLPEFVQLFAGLAFETHEKQ